MKPTFKTEQESFWAGEFGDSYTKRNRDERQIATRTGIFGRILSRTSRISSALELGANVGQNLLALRALLPSVQLTAVEINASAVQHLRCIPNVTVHNQSILECAPEALGFFDLTFTSGVLIHLSPSTLRDVYHILHQCSSRYVLVNEYYNPTPIEVPYREHGERLFKRDFAGEMLDMFPDLELVDYGFQYRRDAMFPAGDTTWFLMRKCVS